MTAHARQALLSRELASLDGEIDEMLDCARIAWTSGNLLGWLMASRLSLAWRLRRWLLGRGVPLPIEFDDED